MPFLSNAETPSILLAAQSVAPAPASSGSYLGIPAGDVRLWFSSVDHRLYLVDSAGSIYSAGTVAAWRTVSASTTLTAGDTGVLVDNGAADVVLTLPAAAGSGQRIAVRKTNDGSQAHTTTLSAGAGDTIEGAGSLILAPNGAGVEILSDGTSAWRIVSAAATLAIAHDPVLGYIGTDPVSPPLTLHDDLTNIAHRIRLGQRETVTFGFDYLMFNDDFVVGWDAAAAPRSVTLNDDPALNGRYLCAYKLDSTANTVTIQSAAGRTINGAASYVLSAQYQAVVLAGDGSGNWLVVAESVPGRDGTVTHVSSSVPSDLSVSVANPSTTPAISITRNSQSANTLLAGPSSGLAATPAYRALVAADIPALDVSAIATGQLVVARGGTGAASAAQNAVFAGPASGGPGAPSYRILVAADIPALDASAIASGQLAVAQGGTGAASAAQNAVFAGPASGGPAAPAFRALATADLPTVPTATAMAVGGVTLASYAPSAIVLGADPTYGFVPLEVPANYNANTGRVFATAPLWAGLAVAADGLFTAQNTSGGTAYSVVSQYVAQQFIATQNYTVNCVILSLSLAGSLAPNGTVTASVYTDNAGSPGTIIGTGGTVPVGTVQPGSGYTSAFFSINATGISASTPYWIVLNFGAGVAGNATMDSRTDTGSNVIATSADGVTWSVVAGPQTLVYQVSHAAGPGISIATGRRQGLFIGTQLGGPISLETQWGTAINATANGTNTALNVTAPYAMAMFGTSTWQVAGRFQGLQNGGLYCTVQGTLAANNSTACLQVNRSLAMGSFSVSGDLIYANENNTGGTPTGALINLQAGGSNRFKVALNGQIIQTYNDSTTTTAPSIVTLAHRTSGTPGANYGASLLFQLDSSTNTLRSAGQIGTNWSTATDGSQAAYMAFSLSKAGSVSEAMRLDANQALGIRSTNPSGNAAALYVPWISGDTARTAIIGSSTSGNNQDALEVYSDSAAGIRAQSASGIPVRAVISDATTTSIIKAASFEHATSGTAGTAFGVQVGFVAQDSTGSTGINQGFIQTQWVDATHGATKARITLNASDSASSLREGIRIEGTGSGTALAFFGATAITKPSVSGSRGGNAALASVITALADLGLLTDSSSA